MSGYYYVPGGFGQGPYGANQISDAQELLRKRLPTLPKPDPEPSGWGLRVTLKTIPGLTSKKVARFLPFTFQVPPVDSFPINRSYPHTDYDPVGDSDGIARQRSKPGSIQLMDVSWRTMFTWDLATWTLLHGDGYTPNPLEMLEKLDQVGQSMRPIQLSARHPKLWERYEVNMPATLRSLNSDESPGEWDTRYVTIQFTEYRAEGLSTSTVGKSARNSRLPVSLASNTLPATKNTLAELAKIYYGRPENWSLIAKYNGLHVGANFDLRDLPGNPKITIPKKVG